MTAEMSIAIFVALALIVVFVSVGRAQRSAQDEATRKRTALQLYQAQRFVDDYKRFGRVPTRDVSIVLKAGELGVFEEPSVLHESKSFRVFGGAGTRVGGISFGGGASESLSRVQPLDAGSLILTTQRLVFDGRQINREVKLREILSISQVGGGIEVSTSRRQNSLILTVNNPALWKTVAENIAAGKMLA